MQPHVTIAWNHEDPNPELVKFKLYENGEMIIDEIAELNFVLLMTGKDYGEYTYQVQADKLGMLSDMSEPVTLNFTRPATPTNVTASLDFF